MFKYIGLILVVFFVIGFINLKEETLILFTFWLLIFGGISVFSLYIIKVISGGSKNKNLGEKELAQSRVDCAKAHLRNCKKGSSLEAQWLDIINKNGN